MNDVIVSSSDPIALIGGGEVTLLDVNQALHHAPRLIAADGGADRALAFGQVPEAVIGDMDSLSETARALLAPSTLHEVTEQETPDFDKALRAIDAPVVIGIGFSGQRVDHMLAAFTTLAKHPDRPCLLLGGDQIVLLCPPDITIDLAEDTLVSLWPLASVSGRSTGLKWPIDGLTLHPLGRVGTSNASTGGRVHLSVEAPSLLLILPREVLPALIEALRSGSSRWPARTG